jgi:hypothetical protein
VAFKGSMITVSAKVWGLRVALIGFIVVLAAATSGAASLALAIAWGPNGLFLWLFMRGSLRLPRIMEAVHPIEPVIYRWLGASLVKRIVATPLWPMIHGFEPPSKSKSRQELLDRTEHTARGAEICHAATFVLASLVSWVYFAVGNVSFAVWTLVFNIILNGYPVMLQRSHRWRIQKVRPMLLRGSTNSARMSVP